MNSKMTEAYESKYSAWKSRDSERREKAHMLGRDLDSVKKDIGVVKSVLFKIITPIRRSKLPSFAMPASLNKEIDSYVKAVSPIARAKVD
jgi:hypothetical protein